MEKLLLEYLQKELGNQFYKLIHFQIMGTMCTVEYYSDFTEHYRETLNIEVWDMLVYINDKTK